MADMFRCGNFFCNLIVQFHPQSTRGWQNRAKAEPMPDEFSFE
jgi:hypothetical protein